LHQTWGYADIIVTTYVNMHKFRKFITLIFSTYALTTFLLEVVDQKNFTAQLIIGMWKNKMLGVFS